MTTPRLIITNVAIHLLNPSLSLDLTANVYFSVASVVLLTLAIALTSHKLVEPRLGAYQGEKPADEGSDLSATELRGLRFALWAFLAVVVFFALLTLPPGAPLRNPTNGRSLATRRS